MSADTDRVLLAAVARGIIGEAQRAAILALESDPSSEHSPGPGPRAAGRLEAPRGFNAVSVAYLVGALLVLFAFGWFLVERWEALGPGGVLAVSLVYTALFAAASRTLSRLGFPTAGGVAALLADAMTPVWGWALQTLAGLWPDASSGDPLLRYPPLVAWRWIPIELATIAVALTTLRRVRFAPLALPIALALAFLVPHLSTALLPEALAPPLEPRAVLLAGTLLLLLAYALDRRQGREEDWAGWLYAVALVACAIGYGDLWGRGHAARHALAPIAALLIAASLFLRRRIFLAAGLLAAFGYLGWLAFDVFRRVLNFPIVLATFGLVVIIATVAVQRRYPALVARVSGSGSRRRDLIPGGWIAAAGPLAIAIALYAAEMPEARERARDAAFRERILMRRAAREEARARRERGGDPVRR